MLLRPCEGGFLVVGDTYFDGFMDGVAVEGMKEPLSPGDSFGGFVIEEIVLREEMSSESRKDGRRWIRASTDIVPFF